MNKQFKVFSTFTGIGGFEIGINHAALNIFGEGVNHIDIVGYSEIDKHAIAVYEKHFGGVKNYGDITKIDAETLPDFDCLVGGFPCQTFSVAGKRAGFNDTRGTLFFDLARILRAKQPRLFVFENVKGLLNHDSGRTFRTIIKTIDELGYDCQWQLLNSKNFGVPQNRERVIIAGHLRGTPRPQVFPITRADIQVSKTDTLKIGTLRTYKDASGFREMQSGLSPTLPARARAAGSGQPVVYIPEATKKGYAEATIGDSINLSQPNSKTRRGRVGKGIANTLDTSMHQYTMQPIISKTVRAGGRNSPHGSKQNWDSYDLGNGIIRRLTPLECERLQAFPDNWTKFGTRQPHSEHACFRCEDENLKICPENTTEISDTQRYKMCGNAVTTNVIQAVFERIFAS